MNEHVSIAGREKLPLPLDFRALRREAIRYAQQLSGEIWTDYNDHDPGVTLLEYLCFALTDLAYRANFSVEDILYAPDENGRPQIENAFFSAVDILPTTPITVADYRRLLIDRVENLRNAWIEPIRSSTQGYSGLFRVRVQPIEEASENGDNFEHDLCAEVEALIMEHRNLCEDLTEVIILRTESIEFDAHINIQPDAFGEKVIARILHVVEHNLNPSVRYYTKEELMEEGQPVSEIFDGPAPLHGFIKKSELKPLPESTYVSRLREIIAKVDGVKSVQNLRVWKAGQRVHGDEIIPSPNSALSLNKKMVDSAGKPGGIILSRNGIPVKINNGQTRQYLNTLAAKSRKGFQLAIDLSDPPVSSSRRTEEIQAYHSFQKLLPTVYGVGINGLPHTANRQQRAQAAQLKAFLLISEQIMANYLAQLANVRQLFSINSDFWASDTKGRPKTYFSQFPFDIPDLLTSVFSLEDNSENRKELTDRLESLSDNFDPADERRNRFLNHLLARFGEEYDGDFLKILTAGDQVNFSQKLVDGKADFLRHYPDLSRNRSRGFNYRKPAWESENVSGLKKRIALLLGIDRHDDDDPQRNFTKYFNRNLSQVPPLNEAQEEAADENSSSLRVPFRKFVKLGTLDTTYQIRQISAEKYELHAAIGKADEWILLAKGNRRHCERIRAKLQRKIQRINTYGEGFFLLENILLRPLKVPGSILLLRYPVTGLSVKNLHLRTLKFTDIQELEELNIELPLLAANPDNWSGLETKDCKGHIVLSREEVPILISEELEEEDFKVAVSKIKEQSSRLTGEDSSEFNDLVDYHDEQLGGRLPEGDFYSLRLSIVVPDWPALFQEKDFQHFFQQVVALQVPAHITVDYYWLDPAEMKCFETNFADWLVAKEKQNTEASDRLSSEIIQQLKPATKETDSKEGTMFKRLSGKLIDQLGKEYGWHFALSEKDFSIFLDLTPEEAELLKANGVPDWKALRRADHDELLPIFRADKRRLSKNRLKSWAQQARLAGNNRWEQLLNYQRSSGQSIGRQSAPATKFEKTFRELRRAPQQILEAIASWLTKHPADFQVPFELLDFLYQSGGVYFFISQNDLEALPMISERIVHKLQLRGVTNFDQLSKIRDRTWQSIEAELKTDEQTDLIDVDLEVVRTLAGHLSIGNWAEFDQWLNDQKLETELRTFVGLKMRRVRGSSNSADYLHPLLALIRERQKLPVQLDIDQKDMDKLAESLGFTPLIPPTEFLILEGVGEKVKTILLELQLSLASLAASSPAALNRELDSSNLPRNLVKPRSWIKQAKLAVAGQWDELIRLQSAAKIKGNIKRGETPLEAAIERWKQQNTATQ